MDVESTPLMSGEKSESLENEKTKTEKFSEKKAIFSDDDDKSDNEKSDYNSAEDKNEAEEKSDFIKDINEDENYNDNSKSKPNFEVNSETENDFEISLGEGNSNDELKIKVLEPKKSGEGIKAFINYTVHTKTNLKQFLKSELNVTRRFSDFLSLHEVLSHKHLPLGRTIPLPPEKDLIGMTKMKLSKEGEVSSSESIEKRRLALERYLNRIGRHPVLSKDDEFVRFLQLEGIFVKSQEASIFSGAGIAKIFGKLEDSFHKMTYVFAEEDEWFEDKTEQMNILEAHLRELCLATETLVANRKDLSEETMMLSRSVANLGSSEENMSLSKVFSNLSEVFGKIEKLRNDQIHSDSFEVWEAFKDHLTIVASIKLSFGERQKNHKLWKDWEGKLEKRKENKNKMETQKKTDKIDFASQEVAEAEEKVKELEKNFKEISETIKKEIKKLDRWRLEELKGFLVSYLDNNIQVQKKIIEIWTEFLPEVKTNTSPSS